MSRRKYTLVLSLCIVVGACDILGADRERLPALLGDPGVPISISVPDTVNRNAKFNIDLTHYGSGSCTKYDGAEVEKVAAGAIIRPFITRPISGTCTADLQFFYEKVELSLGNLGINEIQIAGRYAQRDTIVVRRTFVR